MNGQHLQFVWHPQLSALDAVAWQALAGEHPFLQYAFLEALESSGAVGEESGWQPCHLAVYAAEQLIAAIPLYLKHHSYGEYVFDWSWADAYEQAGGTYYPKLVAAVPFSPVTGPRLLIHPEVADPAALAAAMLAALQAQCRQQSWSGLHVLFPDPVSAGFAEAQSWLRREAVQFRWHNQDYLDWEMFLATLSHDKRKKIRQERKKIAQQDVTCRVLEGAAINPEAWALFYACYCQTYRAHGSRPYLPFSFFTTLGTRMPGQLVMFIASLGTEDVAASLCLYQGDTLYGRYWGALRDVSCLHFELCYYLPQQFCIEKHLKYFEGGAQGVHKLARGFSPYMTCSYHWLAHPDFHQSVAHFLRRESSMVQGYVDELEERSPYRQAGAG